MSELLYEYVFEHNNTLMARLYDPTTKTSNIFEYENYEYIPELYINTRKESTIKSFTTNEPLEPLPLENIFDFYNALKNYKNVPLYGNTNRPQKFIRDNHRNPSEANHIFRTWFFDIEVRSINGYASPDCPVEEIPSIQIWDNFLSKYFILVTRDWTPKIELNTGNIQVIKFQNEKELLTGFVKLLNKLQPSIVCGFNSSFFDVPYITNRMKLLGLDYHSLSPIGEVTSYASKSPEGIEFIKYDWTGLYTLDYRELYAKYSFAKLPRLSLEVIASHELGEGKVEHDEYESMEEFFLTDYDKFMTYGVKDVELLVLLDRKLKFIDTVKMIAYKCGVNLTDVMGTLKQWQSFMYNEAFYINKILPVKQQFNLHDGVYVGGWVKSVPGKYDWVASFDFSSLYPNAIRAINIGVDTLIKNIPEELLVLKKQYFSYYTPDNEEAIKSSNNSKEELFFIMNLIKNKEYIRSVLEKYNVVVSPNGKFFTKKETSLLADLMGRIYSDRKEEQKAAKKYKKLLETEKTPEKMVENRNKFEYHDVAQYTLKIMMNSCYGSTSLAYNPFSFGENMATSITSTGRMLNRWVAFRVNSHINKLLGMPKTKEEIEKCYYTIQSDTDSNYFKIDDLLPLVEGTESEKTKKIVSDILQPVIEKAINEVIYTLNAINPDNSIIAMEHETLADKFISVADKRYYCRYMSDNKPKHKITGLSLIGKSTPKWSKEKLKPVLDIILDKNSNSLVEYIESVREEFKKAPIGDICSIKSLSSVDYPIIKAVDKLYNTSGNSAPFHSRGAIYHNKLNKEMALGFKDISPKDKVYYAYLVLPNPTNQNAISFINPDFMYKSGLIKYVDYNTLFEKNFTKNILLITDPIKWSLNKYQNLFDDWS